ncbi:hypothetical protein [Streptomyces profundus]|uniref:hypothetical protein n=1 Tax=Streptomyces profundus TaxID=2867410 RepID=UPI001D15F853|nr:hypothetical protein [Streptomyces sp. MA3_2.13]UED83197.1 hypothetical protein K4G22_02450 [Streptomyces sp. MA3_2.13]
MRHSRSRSGWPAPRAGQLAQGSYTLPSNTPGFRFHAELTGRWQETPAARLHHDPRAAATHHALQTARAAAGLYPLGEHQAAQVHINTRLGAGADLDGAPVRLLWAEVALTVTATDLAAATALERRLHEETLNEQRRRRRQQEAEELHQALATTPTLTLAYWLTHHPEAADSDTINAINQLAQQITNHAPDNAWVQTARLLQTFAEGLNAGQRANLVESLAQIVTRYDQPGLAEDLRTIATSAALLNGHVAHGPPESETPGR